MTVLETLTLGLQHHSAGRLAEAESAYRQILSAQPNQPDALHLLGVVAQQCGRYDVAIDLLHRAIEAQPLAAPYHSNLGAALTSAGRFPEAIAACREAVRLKPAFVEALGNLGQALLEHGQTDEALATIREVIRLKPDHAMAYFNLGLAEAGRGQIGASVAAYRRALQLNPSMAPAHNNLGNMLQELGLVEESIAAFREALRLQPNYAPAHSNLLLVLHFLPALTSEEIFQSHCAWDRVHASPLRSESKYPAGYFAPERRLRIGYVSPDFREHPVAFFLESLLASHDPAQVEVFCYADVLRPDAVTSRLRHYAHLWRDTSRLPDSALTALIREDCIDILIDLTGHSSGNRLLVFARQPAPVQVTYLGYSDTTGMGAMDYRLTDKFADPPGISEHLHTEQLVRLPECFACFRPADDAPPVTEAHSTRKQAPITFASFHALAKLNRSLLEMWGKILHRVRDSRLLLMAPGLREASAQQRLIDIFSAMGLAQNRLELRARQPLPSYLALHGEVDILLDSHPCSGHTTACHALWMGVPVVTMAGQTHASRMVGSVLSTLGLQELIATNPDEYIHIASSLAADRDRLRYLRATLRPRLQDSPLLDGRRFAKEVERAYRQMWQARCV